MKKRNILIILSSLILLLIILVVAIVVFYKQRNYNKEEEFVMPADLDLTDNELLYGNWSSKTTQIYNNGELELSFEDSYDKMIKFYSSNLMSICYLEEDEYICVDSEYAFVDNKLYIPADTYLSKVSEVIFDEDSLTLKYAYSKKEYSLLSFVRE